MAFGANKAVATISIVADERRTISAMTTLRGKFQTWGRDISKSITGMGRKAGSFLARSFDPLGKGLALVGDAVGDVMNYERGIARMAIAQGKSNDEMSGFRDQLTKISKDTGINRNEILAGAQAYQDLTGDTKGAVGAAKTFADVATATGASVADVASTAAALNQNLKIEPSQMLEAFDALNAQGKAGAVTLAELSAEAARIAPSFAAFQGGTGVKGLKDMGAALQIVRRGAGSTAEARTNLNALARSVTANAKKLEKAGVKVFWKDKDGKKHLREFDTILSSIGESKLMKDPAALMKALGSSEAFRAFQQLNLNQADFQKLRTESGRGSIQRDKAQYKDSAAGQMELAINDLKLAILEALTPERVKKVAEGLSTFAGAIGDVTDAAGAALDGAASLGRAWLGDHRPGAGPDADTIKKRRFERLAFLRGVDASGSAEDIRWRLHNREGVNGKVGLAGGIEGELARARRRLEQEDAAGQLVRSVGAGRTTASFADVSKAAEIVRTGSDAASNEKATAAALQATAKQDLEGGKTAGTTDALKAMMASNGTVDQRVMARELARAFAQEMKGVLGFDIQLDGDKVSKGTANARGQRRHT